MNKYNTEFENENDDFDYIYEENAGEKLPESIVYLKKSSNSFIMPDPRLFDILNFKINNIDDIYCNEIIDEYIEENNDNKIKYKYFDQIKYGMLNCKNIKLLFLKKQAMNEVMNKIDKNIEKIIKNIDKNIFNDIIKFIGNTYKKDENEYNKLSIEYLWSLNHHVIPTAMIMCGENISDHLLHFKYLENELNDNITPLIVRFKQNDIKTNGSFGNKLYHIQTFMINQLFKRLNNWKVLKNNQNNQNNTIKELRQCRKTNKLNIDLINNNNIYFDMKKILKLPELNNINNNDVLSIFIFWYFKYSHLINNYWKKNKNIQCCFNKLPKIIIMIDCIEYWSPLLLSSLIYMLHGMSNNYHNYHNNQNQFKKIIPFILVLGVSTMDNLLSKMIEPESLNLLSIHRYYFQSSYKLYKQVAEKILFESSPILFDSYILNKLLNDNYQLNNYSISKFKHQIRYLFMSYFININGSQYAAYLMYLQQKYKNKKNKNKNKINLWNQQDIEIFDKWWCNEDCIWIKNIQKNININDTDDIYEEFQKYINIKVFNTYQIYRKSIKIFKIITDYLKLNWSQTEIINKLQNKLLLWKYLLTRIGANDSTINILPEERKYFPKKINNNFIQCFSFIYKILHEKIKIFDTNFSDEILKEYNIIISKLNNKNNKYQQININIYDYERKHLFLLLKKFIKKYLKSMNELPLNEIFIYKNHNNNFYKNLYPPTNKIIRERFKNSDKFWSNYDNKQIELEPMSCIYNIYQSSSLYINLYDAYISFITLFNKYNDNDQNKNKNKENEKLKQIQFRMSIDDLKFCGFIKSTNRKKEALMKMTQLL